MFQIGCAVGRYQVGKGKRLGMGVTRVVSFCLQGCRALGVRVHMDDIFDNEADDMGR